MEKKTISCPDCEAKIQLHDKPEVGDILVCDECGVELEIVNTDPVEVDYLLEEK